MHHYQRPTGGKRRRASLLVSQYLASSTTIISISFQSWFQATVCATSLLQRLDAERMITLGPASYHTATSLPLGHVPNHTTFPPLLGRPRPSRSQPLTFTYVLARLKLGESC